MASTNVMAAVEHEMRNSGALNPCEPLDGVFQRYEISLYRMALRQLRNPADAEDALQDALLSALRHIDDFEGRSQVSTWLTKIVINSARMQFRRRHRHETISFDQPSHDEGPSYAERLVSPRATPEELCRESELYSILDRLLMRLPESQRTVFRLRELQGLSTRETAHALSISQGTVKTQLARARAKLSTWFLQLKGTGHLRPKAIKPRSRRRAMAQMAA
jgi:RNA polymerase sigma-70 factor (ECF subfamily)